MNEIINDLPGTISKFIGTNGIFIGMYFPKGVFTK
jgi:hypothetical protein